MSERLAEIKQLYYRATKQTIAASFDRAIDLLKAMPSEDERERATVYMQGLAEMKREWHGSSPESGVRSAKSRVRSARVRSAEPVRSAESVRSATSVRSAGPVRSPEPMRSARPVPSAGAIRGAETQRSAESPARPQQGPRSK